MKKLILVAALFLFTYSVIAQSLIVDAGEDRHLCLGKPTYWEVTAGNPILGGETVVTGGVPPYTYTWEFKKHSFGAFYRTASDLLDDTTIAHPTYSKFHCCGNELDVPYIKLTVVDAVGNVGVDSVKVTISNFGIHLAYWDYGILKGDSIYLSQDPNVFGGFPPLKYSWTPEHGILNPNQRNFWVKPDSSISYTPNLIDDMGCIAIGSVVYNVHVGFVDIEKTTNKNVQLLFPNPTDKFLKLPIGITFYSIFSEEGKVVLEGKDHQEVDISMLSKGNYLINLYKNEVRLGSSKFVKE